MTLAHQALKRGTAAFEQNIPTTRNGSSPTKACARGASSGASAHKGSAIVSPRPSPITNRFLFRNQFESTKPTGCDRHIRNASDVSVPMSPRDTPISSAYPVKIGEATGMI